MDRHTWQPEEGIGFCRYTNTDQGGIGLVVYFGLPIVDLVLFRYGQVALDTTFRIKELDLGSPLDKTIGDLELGLKFPRGHALLLYC